jgi:hypothetical protein
MTTLSPNQIAVYAQAAGIPPGQPIIDAVSVAMAESSGVTDVVGVAGNTGLWQVGPQGTLNDAGVGKTAAQLKDPATNAQAMFTIWSRDGKTFAKSWSSWGNSLQVGWAAKLHANAANWGAASVTTAPVLPLPSLSNPLGSAEALAKQAGALVEWLSTPSNWVRVALVVLGAGLAVAGLNQVAKPVTQPVVAAGTKTAATAAKAAALLA